VPRQSGTHHRHDDAASAKRLARRWTKGWAVARNGLIAILLGSTATTSAFDLVRLADAILIALAMAVVATGSMHLARAVIHRADPAYMAHRETRELVRVDLRFACWWVAAGHLLGVLVLIVPSHLVVALTGLFTTLTIYVYGISHGGDIVEAEEQLGLPGGSATAAAADSVRRWNRRARRAPQLPGTGWFISLWGPKTPVGEVSAYLTHTLLAVVLTSALYAGVATAEVATTVVRHVKTKPAQAPPPASRPAGTGGTVSRPVLPYERHCTALPDPLTIGHGLGELFEHAGAVQAGCGESAIRVSEGSQVWMAPGRCGDELRSLAVSTDGIGAALLYGAPAEFAWNAGNAGLLSYVQVGRPGGGDLAIVATPSGANVFLRTSPSIRPARHIATRCADVDDVARPFVHMPPQLAELWLRLMRRSGWAWSVREVVPGSDSTMSFIDDKTRRTVARGGCADRICHLDSSTGRWASAGAAMITIADLAVYMPPRVK